MTDIFNQMGLVEDAEFNLNILEDLVNSLNNELVYGRYKSALSRMHSNLNDRDKANLIEEAIQHCQNANNNALVVRYLLDLSFMMIQVDRLSDSKSKIDLALTLLENRYRNPGLEFLGSMLFISFRY